MSAFKDSCGRTWPIRISVLSVEQVKTELDLDLYEVVSGPLLELLAAKPARMIDVLWVVLREQAQAQQVSREDLLAAIAGDSLEEAIEAFFRALADFFPKVQRAALHGVLDKQQQLTERSGQAHREILDSGDVERAMEQRIEAHKRQVAQELAKFAAWSGSSPESSASIPAP